MPALILLAGLPGSGKSTCLEELAAAGFKTFDDFHANAQGDSPKPEAAQRFLELVHCLRDQAKCVVADIAFCRADRRAALIEAICDKISDLEVHLWCFENSPDSCRRNLRLDDAARLARIDELTTAYDIPAGARVIPVWDSNS